MSEHIKEKLVNSLLELVEQQSLDSITIKQLLNYASVSKQTFYNYFLDKNDLIQYIYVKKIIPDYHENNMNMNFKESLIVSFYNMKKYHKFLKEACMYEGQNNLKDYMCEHCIEFDLKWHQSLYGDQPISDALKFATIYHARASNAMTLSWILSDMQVTCEEMADMITRMRGIGMDKLFADGDNKNPYQI